MRVQRILQFSHEGILWGFARIHVAVDANFDQVQSYHPDNVINPHPADNSPGQRGNHDAQTTHEYRHYLSGENGKKEFCAGMWWLPEDSMRPSQEQQKVTARHKLQE